MSSLEQRANIKFCIFLKKSPSEKLEMLKKACGNGGMKKTAVCEWHKVEVGTRESDVGCFFDYGFITNFTTNLFLKAKLSIKNLTFKRLRDAIRRKRPKKRSTNDWCSTTSRSDCEKVPYQTQCYHSGTSSLFSQLTTSGFLSVSTAENEIEGTLFCGFR
ncbi:hypothetical protein AVEN_81286-1 [Araneus ventricosus]|uniref:Mos1 transposase HTH domain-containing protein n=1 Tax=Araneus ventricosus TaxID=182803 RepID=A0A4Y2B5K3_ARAVE|nr:hypothetical protein AVEN_81286-1 [Araneus ventricosus]